MLRTNLDTWRLALYVSLGLGTGACGGDSASEAEGAAGSADATTLPDRLRCTGDEPSATDPTLLECDNGIVHRPAPAPASDCEGCVAVGPIFRASTSTSDTCASDADCTDGALCIASVEIVAPPGSSCSSGRVDHFFACQALADECGADAQCADGHLCALIQGERDCVGFNPFPCGSPGRPFSIGSEERVASVEHGAGWCGPRLDPPAGLDAPARATLARYWLGAALREHASVAAFARFTLQLLQLGAPYPLCQQSQRALADEAEHARCCFALASRYAGTALGPGPLSLEGALDAASLAEIALLTFREGCIGETRAAIEAAEALAVAEDPEVRRTLTRIAADERQHAELAWRVIGWVLLRDPTGSARQALRAELERQRQLHALADDGPASAPHRDPTLARHGVLSAQHCARIAALAAREVIIPCAESLLAAPRDRTLAA